MRSRPLFIVCAYEPCGKVKEVKRRRDQRKQKYCTHACAARATAEIRRPAVQAACRKVGLARASQQRQRLLARLDGLSKLECFRLGYKTGLESKTRQIRRRFALVRRTTAA